MPTTIQEIYTQVIRTLSPTERLRLATLILNDLVQHNADVVDQSDTWTDPVAWQREARQDRSLPGR